MAEYVEVWYLFRRALGMQCVKLRIDDPPKGKADAEK